MDDRDERLKRESIGVLDFVDRDNEVTLDRGYGFAKFCDRTADGK